MLKKATDAKQLDDRTWGELLEDLSEVWRDTDAPENPKTNDGHWHHATAYEFEEMEALGLSEPEPEPKPEPKKRGRPPKKQVESDATNSQKSSSSEHTKTEQTDS